MEELSMCPGMGPTKVKNLHDVFRAPFDPTKRKAPRADSKITDFPLVAVKKRRKEKEPEEEEAEENEHEGGENEKEKGKEKKKEQDKEKGAE